MEKTINEQLGYAIAEAIASAPADFARKSRGKSKKRKNCVRGYPCGGTCISISKNCRKPLKGQAAFYAAWLEKHGGKVPGVKKAKAAKATEEGSGSQAEILKRFEVAKAKETDDRKNVTKKEIEDTVSANPYRDEIDDLIDKGYDYDTATLIGIGAIPNPEIKAKVRKAKYSYSFEQDVASAIDKEQPTASIYAKSFSNKYGAPPPSEEQLKALTLYSARGYESMNGFMRKGQGQESGVDGDVSKETRMAAAALMEAPEAARYRGLVHRSTSTTKDKIANYKVGRVVEEAGFVSTTSDPEVATIFRGIPEESRVTLNYKIVSKNGVYIEALSEKGENEVLFPPGTKFRVKKVSEKDDPSWGATVEVEMEEVNGRTRSRQILQELDEGKYKAPYREPSQFQEGKSDPNKQAIADKQAIAKKFSNKTQFLIGLPD